MLLGESVSGAVGSHGESMGEIVLWFALGMIWQRGPRKWKVEIGSVKAEREERDGKGCGVGARNAKKFPNHTRDAGLRSRGALFFFLAGH